MFWFFARGHARGAERSFTLCNAQGTRQREMANNKNGRNGPKGETVLVPFYEVRRPPRDGPPVAAAYTPRGRRTIGARPSLERR